MLKYLNKITKWKKVMVKVIVYTSEQKENLLNCVNNTLDKESVELLSNDLDNYDKTVCEYLIALDESGKCIGYSKTTLLTKGYMQLNDLFVVPYDRRTGTGSLILVAVMTRAIAKCVVNLFAKCDVNNKEGLAFLKARAFIRGEDNLNTAYFTKSLLHMYMKKD